MFIKVTNIEGKTAYINADKIMWIVPYSERGHIDASIIDTGAAHIRVSESPDMIMKLIERNKK